MDHGTTFWIAAVLATLCVGMGKGGFPMIAMLSVPVMTITMPAPAAAGLMLPMYLLSDGYGIWLFRRSFSRRNLAILIPAGAIGIVLAFLLVSRVPERATTLLVALVGLGYLANSAWRRWKKDVRPRPADVPRGLFWGALAGFTSYISHAGGPPYQAYVLPQRLEKMRFAGTTTILFAVINFLKVPPYIVAGQITWGSLSYVLLLGPVALVGAKLGHMATLRLPERVFFVFIEIALLALSLKLLVEAVTG